jgi:hypothetical protein
MIGALARTLLRPLLAPLARFGANFVAAGALAVGAELAAERFLDADLPRSVTLMLLIVLIAAWRFLVSRRRRAAGGARSRGAWQVEGRVERGVADREGRGRSRGALQVEGALQRLVGRSQGFMGGGAAGPGRISRR